MPPTPPWPTASTQSATGWCIIVSRCLAKVEGVSIQGGASQVVRGMPFSLKVTPALTSDRVTVAVNGINKVVDAAIANLSIAAVTEDLDITIQVNPAGANAYTVVNVREGSLHPSLSNVRRA